MRTKFISLSIALLMGVSAWAQVSTVSIYEDCSKNGKTEDIRPTTGPENVQAVDLGLPSGIKWASCNIGAEKPEDYGNYYAWGEVSPKEDYSWATYKYANGASDKLTKYCNDASYGDNGFTDNKTTLDPEDDAAHVNWGGSWRMPTDAEWAELIANCTWTWTTQNGINGYRVTSKTNSNSIFLPAAGYRYDTYLYDVGGYGYYWSSSVDELYPSSAWSLGFGSDGVGRSGSSRHGGQSVRPVCPSISYTLTLYANGCESANVFTCNVGQQVNISAVPLNDQQRFLQWNDGNTANPRLVTVSQDMTLTAEFVSATPTAVEQTQDCQDNNQNVTIQKIIRNGQVLIQKGNKIYTVTGQEVNE